MLKDNLRVALYARVSGEQQEKEDTIASQLEAVTQRIASDGFECETELRFVDDGCSGFILTRPGLERLRDQAAAGVIDLLYVLDPDRIARKYAYQVLMLEELSRCGVEVVFLRNPPGNGPEENLLLQVQGMIAEYERAKILERSRRGKQYAARRGSVNVLGGAPYGYRYVGKYEGGGEARYQVVAEEARVVRKIFEWIGQQRCSIGEVCRRLQRDGIPTRTGKPAWDRSTVWLMLKNPAYKGTAAFGKTRSGPLKPQRLRPQRGRPEQSRRPFSTVETSSEDQIFINVPGLVSEELFGVVQAQLEENRQRRRARAPGGRYLLQGLIVCKRCGYGCYGKPVSRSSAKGKIPYAYYRCTGSDAYRFGGQRLCWNKQVRTDVLDAAVWKDVSQLLAEPERVRVEYQRRLQATGTDTNHELEHINKIIKNIRKLIARLIDAYGDGLLDKSEFEPRILSARERVARWEDEYRQQETEVTQEAELRLVIGQLEEFARRISEEMREPSWETRREVIRALVKKVEVDQQEVRIVYRVSPSPFEGGPQQRSLLHCWGRGDAALRCSLFGGIEDVLLHEPGFQPFLEDGFAHRDLSHQPFVADPVEARLDISLEDPAGTAPVAQDDVALIDGVGRRSFLPEPVRVRVGRRLRDGIECLQVERLHRAIFHRGDAHSTLPHHPNHLRDSLPSPIHIIRSAVSESRSSAFGVDTSPISSSDSPTGGMPPSPSAVPIIWLRRRMIPHRGQTTSWISTASVRSSRCSITSLETGGRRPLTTTPPRRPQPILAKITPIVPTPHVSFGEMFL
jgi:site-specific DNA recombinase